MVTNPRISRTLWPLPGGVGSYLSSLVTFLEIVAGSESMDSAVASVLGHFSQVSSLKAARSYLHVVADLGLIEIDGYRVVLTEAGDEYLRTRDTSLVSQALTARIAGVNTILQILVSRPRRMGLIHAELQRSGFSSWRTDKQVRHRLRWLEEVGLVGKRGRGRPEYYLVER